MPKQLIGAETTATRRAQARLGEPMATLRGIAGSKTLIYEVNARPWLEPPLLAGADVSDLDQISPQGSSLRHGNGGSSQNGADGNGPGPNGAGDNGSRQTGAGDNGAQVGESQDEPEAASGPGIINVRLSSYEMQGGETHIGQLIDCWEMCRRNRLPVSHVIICTEYHSELRADEREDFSFVLEQIALGQVHFLAMREADRVARAMDVAYAIYRELQDSGVELWLAENDRALDWDNDSDQLQMAFSQILGQVEKNKLVRKMSRAKRRRWLDEGRGWPGALPFGFKRGPKNFPMWDDKQWWVVKFIHEKFRDAVELQADLKNPSSRSGVKVLHEWLAERKIDLSPDRIRSMLHDTIYADGRYTVRDADDLVECEPAQIPEAERIPMTLIQANIELLACQKGPHSNVPVGAFCLNGIKVIHEACSKVIDKRNGRLPNLLKGRRPDLPDPCYIHVPKNPCGSRYALPQRILEPAVVRELWRLADDPEVQAAWSAATRSDESQAEPAIINGHDETRLREEIENLESEIADLHSEVIERASRGNGTEPRVLSLIDSLSEAVDAKKDQLDLVERQSSRRSRRRAPMPGRSHDELKQALREVLTEEVPEDARARVRRMAVIEACLSEVWVRDVLPDDGSKPNGKGEIEIRLFGPLAPVRAIEEATAGRAQLPVSPLDAAGHVLVNYLDEQDVETDGVVAVGPEVEGTTEGEVGNDAGADRLDDVDRKRDGADERVTPIAGLPEPGMRPRRSVRALKARPTCKSRLTRRYFDPPTTTTRGRRRWDRRHVSSWERYLEAFAVGQHRDKSKPGRQPKVAPHYAAVFISPWLALSESVSGFSPWREAFAKIERECERAIRQAAATLPTWQVLSMNHYEAFRRDHPEAPAANQLNKVARSHGVEFPEWRARVLASELPAQRRSWTLKHCIEALRVTGEEADRRGVRLTRDLYMELASARPDRSLPSLSTVVLQARAEGMTFAQLKERVLDST